MLTVPLCYAPHSKILSWSLCRISLIYEYLCKKDRKDCSSPQSSWDPNWQTAPAPSFMTISTTLAALEKSGCASGQITLLLFELTHLNLTAALVILQPHLSYWWHCGSLSVSTLKGIQQKFSLFFFWPVVRSPQTLTKLPKAGGHLPRVARKKK